jgi:hypothetical protein
MWLWVVPKLGLMIFMEYINHITDRKHCTGSASRQSWENKKNILTILHNNISHSPCLH